MFGVEKSTVTAKRCNLQNVVRREKDGSDRNLVRIHDCNQTTWQCKASATSSSKSDINAGEWQTKVRLIFIIIRWIRVLFFSLKSFLVVLPTLRQKVQKCQLHNLLIILLKCGYKLWAMQRYLSIMLVTTVHNVAWAIDFVVGYVFGTIEIKKRWNRHLKFQRVSIYCHWS